MIIYKITNNITGKMYVGKTSTTLKKRWKHHCYQGKSNRCIYLKNAIKKYNKENFSHEIIEECSKDIVDSREIYWIAKLNTLAPLGYNLRGGGDSGAIHPDTKKKMSEAALGKPKPEKVKVKIAKTLKGTKKSKTHAANIKKAAIKRGLSKRGIKRPEFSDEWKENMSKAKRGKKLSESHKKAISEGLRKRKK